MQDFVIITIATIVGLIGLASLVMGAISLFVYASEQGFIGLAAYVACWVFLAPIMAIISFIMGLFALFVMAKERMA